MKKYALIVPVAALMTAGCATPSKLEQLQEVARDWSMVVRASQVIPVYPLSQDVQPGDVFLVQSTAAEEATQYDEKGFLPLEQRLARLQVQNYNEFYQPTVIRSNELSAFRAGPDSTQAITNAPRAAFPSYSFTVQEGGGLDLAIPVQGVPIGLSVLGTSSAAGTIAFTDAYTYGTDLTTLLHSLQGWVDSNAAWLQAYYDSSKPRYLRTVTRVYLVRGVNVALTASGSGGVSASGGVGTEVNVPVAGTNALENYTNLVAQLNSATSTNLSAGGSLKFVSATSRSVSMNEEFDTPLVLGYLAFDVPILTDKNGTLGIGQLKPTQTRLTTGETTSTNSLVSVNYGAKFNTGTVDLQAKVRKWLSADSKNFTSLQDWVAKNTPIPRAGIWVSTASKSALEKAITELNIQ